MSTKSPDRRIPCGGWQTIPHLGGCSNHTKASLRNIPVLTNTTKMLDYHSASYQYITPYVLAEEETAPDCSPYNAGEPWFFVCGDGLNNNVFCTPATAEMVEPTSSGTLKFSVGNLYNTYVTSSQTMSLSTCRILGTKQVYANKCWQGRFGYTSRTCNQCDTTADYGGTCCHHNYDTTPETTKFLGVTATATVIEKNELYTATITENGLLCDDPLLIDYCYDIQKNGEDTISTQAASNTVHVDTKGNIYCDSVSGNDGLNADAWALLAMANGNCTDIWGIFGAFLLSVEPPHKIEGDGTYWTLTWETQRECLEPCPPFTSTIQVIPTATATINLAGNTVNVSTYEIQPALSYCLSDGACVANEVGVKTSETLTFSNTTVEYEYVSNTWFSPVWKRVITKTMSGELTTPYTSGDVYEECIAMLAYWPLDNDSILPWRLTLDKVGPLVSYDEGQAAPAIGTTENNIRYSGALRGRPAPVGIDRVWNFFHENWNVCDSLVNPDCKAKYVESEGAWSDDAGIPCATQWLNTYQATQVPEGAFQGMNFFQTTPPQGASCDNEPTLLIDDTLWLCKYAKAIIDPKHSINFARPCGLDRFQVTSSAYCVSQVSASVVTLEPLGPAGNFANGEYVWLCGTDVDGCYTVAGASAYSVTLGSCVVSASALPDVPLDNCGSGLLAKLRWQPLKPAICGRVDISNMTSTAPVTCSLLEPTYLVNGDTIYITGSVIDGQYTVSVMDASTVILNGSDGTAITGYTASSAQMFSSGAADWRWNDNGAKNEYEVLTWNMSNRLIGEYNRIYASNENAYDSLGNPCTPQTLPDITAPLAYIAAGFDPTVTSMVDTGSCTKFSPCNVSVAFFSPQTESFYGKGKNHGFPTITPDPTYGGVNWNGIIRQAIPDPFWQEPPCPCSYDAEFDACACYCLWTEDDGTCQPDVSGNPEFGIFCENFFPHRPMVEARTTIPDGAPSLPSGINIGCLTPDQILSGSTGNICNPPDHNANYSTTNFVVIYSYTPYHYLYLLESGCVDADGRFAEDYKKDGI